MNMALNQVNMVMHNLQGQFSVVQGFILILNMIRFCEIFISVRNSKYLFLEILMFHCHKHISLASLVSSEILFVRFLTIFFITVYLMMASNNISRW